MCRKRTLGEVAGERIVCDENFACLTILAPALSDRAISGGKHMIFQHINNIHLARLDLNKPVCILIPKVVVIADNISKFGDVPKDYSNYLLKLNRDDVIQLGSGGGGVVSSWLAEQGAGGSSPGLATSNFCILFSGYRQRCVTNRDELKVSNINSIKVYQNGL